MKVILKRSHGTPFTTWYGDIPTEEKKKARFLTWRDFYNDDFTPVEAIIKVME